MTTIPRTASMAFLILAGALLALGGCDRGAAETGGKPTDPRLKPGMAVGRITHADGRPLNIPDSRVMVFVRGPYSQGDKDAQFPVLGPQGDYELPLRLARYRLEAALEVKWHDDTYRLGLDPLDGDTTTLTDGAHGMVKDFQLKLTGLRPGAMNKLSPQSYYGATLRLAFQRLGARLPLPGDTPITVVLAPKGPYIDGRPASVATRRMTKDQWSAAEWLDIPIGRYTVSITVAAAGEEPAPGRIVGPNSQPVESLEFRFGPVPDGDQGAETFTVTLFDAGRRQ